MEIFENFFEKISRKNLPKQTSLIYLPVIKDTEFKFSFIFFDKKKNKVSCKG